MHNFLWKGNIEKSLMIQVKWNQVCQSKKNGGLKMHSLKAWNEADLAKLIDDILTAKTSIWVAWATGTKLKGETF